MKPLHAQVSRGVLPTRIYTGCIKYREICENEQNLTLLTLAMTFRVIQSNPSLHSLLSPSWGSFMPK